MGTIEPYKIVNPKNAVDLCCEDFLLTQEYNNMKVTSYLVLNGKLEMIRINRSIIYYCPFCGECLIGKEIER